MWKKLHFLFHNVFLFYLTFSQTTTFQTLPRCRSLQTTNLIKMADSSQRVENTVEKGEIAREEQFLLFPSAFKRHT